MYLNDGKGNFRDGTLLSGLAVETRFVTWGVGVADLDNDGNPDIFAVTGGIYPEVRDNYNTPRVRVPEPGQRAVRGAAGAGRTRCERAAFEPRLRLRRLR